MREVVIEEPLLWAGDVLGEAPVWDLRKERLYWVDIDGRRVHWYEPKTSKWSFRRFAAKVSAIACTESGEGLVGAVEDGFVFIPFIELFHNSDTLAPVDKIETLVLGPGEKRFNEGMVDPSGRFLSGTMGFKHGTHDGQMYTLERGIVNKTPILRGITCTNGMGWVESGSKMYFTDSWEKRIDAYDYDLLTGRMSNQRSFSSGLPDSFGWPDGLCIDTEGGVWSARWGAGKVIRLDPNGDVDVVIDFPRAWNMTSCVFGGDHMADLYVTSAKTDIEGDGPTGREDGGSVYVVRGLGFSGLERYRYVQ